MGRWSVKHWLFFSLLLHSALVSADALSDRLGGFAAIKESRVSFVDTWSAEYLEQPLISKGKLEYKRPGQLTKFITGPDRIEQRIDGNRLTVMHNDEVRSIPLSEQPELAAGIIALQAVLDGDENKLRKHFELKYSELNIDWILSLIPKNKQVADSIDLITFKGNGNRIQQITIQFHNGDSLLSEIMHDS